jgi:adenylate cyclase
LIYLFNELTERYGLEKIKAIGDAYMVVGGLPEPKPGQGRFGVKFAVNDQGNGEGRRRPIFSSHRHSLRWGDTKYVASQIESSRTTNSIQFSDAIYRTLKCKLRFRKRGTLDIKGIGAVQPTFCWRRPDV